MEQALLVVQVVTVETVEASSSTVVTSRTCHRLFQQSTGTLAKEHGTVSEGQEPVEQDDFPIDNANDKDSEKDDDDAIPSNRLSLPWDPFWGYRNAFVDGPCARAEDSICLSNLVATHVPDPDYSCSLSFQILTLRSTTYDRTANVYLACRWKK
jgi:hypothetical protein